MCFSMTEKKPPKKNNMLKMKFEKHRLEKTEKGFSQTIMYLKSTLRMFPH